MTRAIGVDRVRRCGAAQIARLRQLFGARNQLRHECQVGPRRSALARPVEGWCDGHQRTAGRADCCDIVVIQRSDTADNGAIVVALIDQHEVTLKRLRRKGASIALEPANQAYETRIFGPDRVKVQGKLIGLLRRY